MAPGTPQQNGGIEQNFAALYVKIGAMLSRNGFDIKIKYLMTVKINNVGAIYLANNQTVNRRTNHVNICYHFVHQLIEHGTVKVEIVRSKENEADVGTKNLGAKLFNKHVDSYVMKFPSK